MTETQKDPQALQAYRPMAVAPRWRMVPTSLGEALEMATLLAKSELVPKAYRGRPEDCIVAYEYGAAIGLAWMQALRSISVINGVAALWGDAIPALILGSGECERFHEYYEGEKGTDAYAGVCIMKRKGLPDERIVKFSVADAKKAGLWGKPGPWQQYQDRMLQMRPRGFCARDLFADKLSGLIIAEEAMDYPTVEGTVVSSETVESPAMTAFNGLPEGLRDNIEKAFTTLNLAPGLRLAKINEFLGADDVTAEDGAQRILDWARDEFSKRKTGAPRKKKDGNDKKSKMDDAIQEMNRVTLEAINKPQPTSVGSGQTDAVKAAQAEADKHASIDEPTPPVETVKPKAAEPMTSELF